MNAQCKHCTLQSPLPHHLQPAPLSSLTRRGTRPLQRQPPPVEPALANFPTNRQADKLASRQVGNPRTPARARLHPVFAPPAAPHRPPPAEPRTLSSLTRRVNQKPTTSSSSCLHPPPHHAPAALARQQQTTNPQEPGGGAAPPPPIAAKPSTLQHRRPLQRQPPPAEPAPPTRAGCFFSPYPRNRRTMPPPRSPPDLTPPLAHLYPAAPLLRPALTVLPGGKPKTHPPAEPVPAAPAPPASANVHTSSHPTAPGESPRA